MVFFSAECFLFAPLSPFFSFSFLSLIVHGMNLNVVHHHFDREGDLFSGLAWCCQLFDFSSMPLALLSSPLFARGPFGPFRSPHRQPLVKRPLAPTLPFFDMVTVFPIELKARFCLALAVTSLLEL